jgi:phosphate transport system permease protein
VSTLDLSFRVRRGAVQRERAFQGLAVAAAVGPLLLLIGLLLELIRRSAGALDWQFLTSFPSRKPELAGVYPAVLGSIEVVALTVAIGLPVGIAAAIYLEEYGGSGRFARLIETNVTNLAGVPSIIYGILGLEVFVRASQMGRSVIAGACTLALLVLPLVITTTREALRTVPDTLREAAYGLGATRLSVVLRTVLPVALPGVLTGAILAVSRALGETAPLVVVGALAYMTFLPDGPMSPFTVLPIQIFNWVSRPQEGFRADAAAAIVVLLSVLLLLNLTALIARDRARRAMDHA